MPTSPLRIATDPAAARAAARSALGGAALLVLCLSVYLPGLFVIPAVDRDEARFAQASRQMFESVALPPAQRTGRHAGGLVVPMLQDKPRLNKPPLIYWLQSSAAAIFTAGDPAHDAIWMYRVPSALAAMLNVLLTWRLGLRMFDPRAAWLGAALLAICPMIVWDAHQARADQVLLTTCVAAQLALWRLWRDGPSLGWAGGFWLAIAAGIMTKGPIAPMVSGLTALSLCLATGRWDWLLRLRPILGTAVVGAAVGPWILAVAQQQGGLTKYLVLVYEEVDIVGTGVERVVNQLADGIQRG